MRANRLFVAWIIASFLPGSLLAQGSQPRVVFMEPVDGEDASELVTYRAVDNPATIKKYTTWLENESAQWALDLHDRAWATMKRRGKADQAPPYHIALVPRGNHVDTGFRLQGSSGVVEYPTLAYMKLAPERWRFGNTLLHETGHIVLAALAGGDRIPARRLASIPHTTAALTDRGRAFNEGFAIHLETLAAHLSDEQDVRKRYRHEGFDFGGSSLKSAEYFKHAADLLSFSQTIARYYEVRENNFAFASAFREPDYLRVQMEKARDFSTLRNANQLLQSEGFYASFFFSYTMRGEETPTREVIDDRQNKMMDALAEMFAAHPMDTESPHLLRFVETFMRMYPSHGGEVVDVLLDLSHGVFVDAEAEALWKDFYLAALRLDMANLPRDRVTKARDDWRAAVLKDPKILYSRLGPQLRCMVPSLTVLLAALGQPAPLSFDVNTAEEGIIRMIPGITDAEVKRWLSRREEAPFAGVDDFKTRSELSAGCLDGMKLDSGR